ncbi:hypothetical protein AVEN_41742-1 [Araneus ventricosus]|uniref:Uncharacterized protein n=1 Tax=Araneus ventricosus TaxID=182803 RepID=A0A4Y2ADB6_ARAVE|nr:hypothetical protein AVEN_41742-1 [Araneus ventricosus]
MVHFRDAVKDPPKSIDLNRWKTIRSLGQMEWIGLLVNARLKVTDTVPKCIHDSFHLSTKEKKRKQHERRGCKVTQQLDDDILLDSQDGDTHKLSRAWNDH